MENSLLFIFGEIWPNTLYYSTGTLAQFWSNLILIGISSKFLCNISTRTCICIRKNYENGEFSPFHFWRNLAKVPVL